MKLVSWKTTLVGCLLALCVAIQPILSNNTVDWKNLVIAGLIAVFSFLAKDSNVTGGNVNNNLTVK